MMMSYKARSTTGNANPLHTIISDHTIIGDQVFGIPTTAPVPAINLPLADPVWADFEVPKPKIFLTDGERSEMLKEMNKLLKERHAARTTYPECPKCKMIHGDKGCI